MNVAAKNPWKIRSVGLSDLKGVGEEGWAELDRVGATQISRSMVLTVD